MTPFARPTIRQRFGSTISAAADRRRSASRAQSMTTQSWEDRMWAEEEARSRRSLSGTPRAA
jgi:hypothetical protein